MLTTVDGAPLGRPTDFVDFCVVGVSMQLPFRVNADSKYTPTRIFVVVNCLETLKSSSMMVYQECFRRVAQFAIFYSLNKSNGTYACYGQAGYDILSRLLANTLKQGRWIGMINEDGPVVHLQDREIERLLAERKKVTPQMLERLSQLCPHGENHLTQDCEIIGDEGSRF